MTRSFAFVSALCAVLFSGTFAACEPAAPPAAIEEVASLDPGFEVVRAEISPDGKRLVLAGKEGAGAVIDITANQIERVETGVSDPNWVGFAPDSSEFWMMGGTTNFARFTPDGARLPDETMWETTAGDAKLSSPEFGTLVLSQNGASAETKGRIVEHAGGQLALGGSVFIARAPNNVVQFTDGEMRGDTGGDGAPVQLMAVACGGACLLTAADSSAEETFYWSLAPFDSEPKRLNGRVFLDGGDAALDGDGKHVLFQNESGVQRLALPLESAPSGDAANVTARGAKLSDDARYALIDEEDYVGWRLFDAATMQPIAGPQWLSDDQSMAVLGPKGRFAVFLDGETSGMRLSKIPYESILQVDSDPEMVRTQFSPRGTMVLLHDNAGAGTLYRSEDGSELGKFADNRVMFTPDDAQIIEIGKQVKIYRVTE